MRFFEVDFISRKNISIIFLLKILSGVALWFVYTYYYTNRATADIYKYFDDSKIIFDSFSKHPLRFFKLLFGIGNNTSEFDVYYSQMNFWARKLDSSIYNDSHTIIRLNAVLRFFSLGFFNVHTVFFSFFSLVGLTAIYKTFVTHFKDKHIELIIVVYLLPSVMFWGSGVLKEAIILFSLGMLVYYFNSLFKPKAILYCSVFTLILALSKFYVWLSILPGLIFLFWINRTSVLFFVPKFFLVMLCALIIGTYSEELFGLQSPFVTLSQKQLEFKQLISGNALDANNNKIEVANSVLPIPILEPTLPSFLKNAPEALFNLFFRPFIWDSFSPLVLMAALENLVILLVILCCLIFIKPIKEINWVMVLFCLSFVIIQYLIIGETTPILGAIVRYKVPAIPFLLIAFLLLLDKTKLRKKSQQYLINY
jgi:hypothetical protein